MAAVVGCSAASVWNGRRAYATRGVSGLEEHPRPGAARRVDCAGVALLEDLLGTDPHARGWQATGWTVPVLREELARAGYRVSTHTVRRTLHRLRWRWKRPAYLLGRPDPAYTAKKGWWQRGQRR